MPGTSEEIARRILMAFAPEGSPTVDATATMRLMCAATGRSVEFPAANVSDVAAVLTAFALCEESAGIPEWIRESRDFAHEIRCDEDGFVLRFGALAIGPKSVYAVLGGARSEKAEAWGYEIVAADGHFGWVIVRSPDCFVVTGVRGRSHSKHRTLHAARFRIATHLKSMDAPVGVHAVLVG